MDTRARTQPGRRRLSPRRTAPSLSSGTTPASPSATRSIISIGRSKREDASTIGKYGLGFNVSYHFTDTPQFVSSSSVVVFDPHGRAISDGSLGLRADFTGEFGAAQPGLVQPLLRPLAEIEALMLEPADRSHPDQPIRSTLFRFPLRDADAAAQSSLSQRVHSADDVRGLLEELEVGLGEMLLFVQHVQKIALLEVGDDGALRVFASVALDTTPAIADARRSMAAIARPSASVAAPTVTAPLRFELPLALTIGGETTRQRWLIVCGACTHDDATLLASALGGSLPYAAVAAPLQAADAVRGRAYCFLPLPIATGLPLHVTANFALSSNRRELWSADGDDAGGGHAAKARWNALLCEEALPELLVHALEHAAADAAIGRDRLDRLWPRGASGGRWSTLEQRALRLLSSRGSEVCYDPGRDGWCRWYRWWPPTRRQPVRPAALGAGQRVHRRRRRALAAARGALAALAAAGVVVERSSRASATAFAAAPPAGIVCSRATCSRTPSPPPRRPTTVRPTLTAPTAPMPTTSWPGCSRRRLSLGCPCCPSLTVRWACSAAGRVGAPPPKIRTSSRKRRRRGSSRAVR